MAHNTIQTREQVQAIDDHGRRVQAMFSDIAPGYDLANRLMSMGTDIRWRRRAIRSLLPHDSPASARVLDLCAGTLDCSLEIHRQYPCAAIIGGDFSAGMLAAGRRRLKAQATEAIETMVMDAHKLPLASKSQDAIFCAFGVRNISDLERATKEQARCLRPGGRLTVLDFFRPTRTTTRLFHAFYNRTVLPAVGWACTGNLEAYLYLPRSISAFSTARSYAQLLERCGFESATVSPLTMGVASIVQATRSAAPGRPS